MGEACDDGNSVSGDGCGANCATIEKDYTCPQPGVACVYLVKCGDGRLGGKETCDDGNVASNDGCSATCTGETGWDCGTPGLACTAHCGDGVLKAAEQCEPPNPGKGCSAGCKIEPGYVCAAPPATPNPAQPATCHKSVCGDGIKEGAEACDDKNVIDGDGCAATCTLEPDCSTGLCASKCGDGLKLTPEGCDDGNVVDGDGCAKACTLEMGYTCTDSSGEPPARLNLAVTYRDFISFPTGGSTRHPDFERFWGDDITPLLVKPALGPTGKPVMDGRCVAAGQTAICPKGPELTTMANFDQWYNDVAAVNINIPGALLLPRQANGSYVYDSAKIGFYPIDKKGWTAAPVRENTAIAEAGVNDGLAHNFGFTTEIRYFFQYRGGESLTFSGDDDVWIFVNRRLALDLGGLHPPIEKTLDVDASAAALGLTVGGLYEVVLFHAERHTAGSNFKLTLTGFAPTSSTCGPRCGDGVVVAPEQCDLGADMNTGQYNGCTAECRRGPVVRRRHRADARRAVRRRREPDPVRHGRGARLRTGMRPQRLLRRRQGRRRLRRTVRPRHRHEHRPVQRLPADLSARPTMRRQDLAEGRRRGMRRRQHRGRRRLRPRLQDRVHPLADDCAASFTRRPRTRSILRRQRQCIQGA